MSLYHRLLTPTLAAIVLACGAPAAAEVTRTTELGFVSRHEVVVKADAKAVWLALIDPAKWWRSDHTWSGSSANLMLTPQAGGCFCETIPEVDEPDRFTLQGSVEHMRVIQAYPESALRMSGALGPLQSEPVTGILTIAISKVDQGTRIVWEYNVGGSMRYEVPVISKAVDAVMGAQLTALAKLLGPVALPPPAPKPEPAAPAPDQAPAAPVTGPAPRPMLKAEPMPATAPGATPKPAAEPAAKPAPKPDATKLPAKPAPKSPSVDDAFSDLKDDPAR